MENLNKEEAIKLMLSYINKVKELGKNLGYPNILYNEQYKELELATILGHTYNEGQGEDATTNDQNCEYKTMVGDRGSFQYHWLSTEKMIKLRNTPHHYFGVYNKDTSKIDRIYYLPLDKILPEFEEVYKMAESNRLIINENTTSSKKKSKNIDAHKSFSLSKIKKLGAVLKYGKEPLKTKRLRTEKTD